MKVTADSPQEVFFQRAQAAFPEIKIALEVASEAGDGVWATKLENFADVTRGLIRSGDFVRAASHINFICNSINDAPIEFQLQIKYCFFDWFWGGLSADEIKQFQSHLPAV